MRFGFLIIYMGVASSNPLLYQLMLQPSGAVYIIMYNYAYTYIGPSLCLLVTGVYVTTIHMHMQSESP